MSIVKNIHQNLEKAIEFVIANKQDFVKNPTTDFTRNRKLTLEKVIKLIISMEGGSLKKELYDFGKTNKIDVTSSAFVQQRSKIQYQAFETILKQFNSLSNDREKYKGYRVFAVDGSKINHFRNPDLESFITTLKNEKGFNQTHLNALYDVLNRTFKDILLQPVPKSNEHEALITMLKRNAFQGNNIIIADRGYEGYNLIAHLINTENVDFLMRVKQGKGAFRDISKLPMIELDKDISFELTTTQTKEDKMHNRIFIQIHNKNKCYSSNTVMRNWDFGSPYAMSFRVVRFMLDTGEYETVITSLPRSKFSMSEIKALYHMRWGIETSFREVKYVVGLINFHCKKEDLVKQEIYSSIIMYNYCSRIVSNAKIHKRDNAVYNYKVDYTMAVHLCRLFYKKLKTDFKELIIEIEKYTEPIRPGRRDKRNLRTKHFVGFAYRVAA